MKPPRTRETISILQADVMRLNERMVAALAIVRAGRADHERVMHGGGDGGMSAACSLCGQYRKLITLLGDAP